MTIFVCDTEGDGLLETLTLWHCLVFKALGEDIWYAFCDLSKLPSKNRKEFEDQGIRFFDLSLYKRFLESPKTTGLICHNIFGHDLPAMEKLDGLKFTHTTISGRVLDIMDSLVYSRYLNPERRLPKGCPGSVKNEETGRMDKIGPHGLESWGYRTGVAKPSVHDWRTQPLEVYIHRCIEDVKINEAAYFLMQREIEDVAIENGTKKGEWVTPLRMSQRVFHLMCKQERDGACFDKEKAKALLPVIDDEMKAIEIEVEPTLGEKPLGKQPNFPSNIWKQPFDPSNIWTLKGELRKPVKEYLLKLGYTDEESQKKFINCFYTKDRYDEIVFRIDDVPKYETLLTTHAVNYCKKFGIFDHTEMVAELDRVAKGGSPRQLMEKLRLKHKKDVKEFFIKDGWSPTIWKYRNIVINKKTKQKLTEEEIEVKYKKYLKEFEGSPYWPFILKDLGYKRMAYVDTSTASFRAKVMKKGRGLMSSPQYKDDRGNRCINLEKLLGETSLKIIRWLSLHNRRSTIQSFKEDTGWLNNSRLAIDGRLGARSSGVTPTSRQKHSVVVNVPKPDPSVVLGKEMRSLFFAPPGYWNIGCDASGIEARVAGHYAFFYDGGIYANELLIGDVHQKNSKAYTLAIQNALLAKIKNNDHDGELLRKKIFEMEITRSAGKNLTYAKIMAVYIVMYRMNHLNSGKL